MHFVSSYLPPRAERAAAPEAATANSRHKVGFICARRGEIDMQENLLDEILMCANHAGDPFCQLLQVCMP